MGIFGKSRKQKTIDGLLQEGRRNFQMRDFSGAARCYDQVLELNPGNTQALFNKSISYAAMMEFQTAYSVYLELARRNGGTSEMLLKSLRESHLKRFHSELPEQGLRKSLGIEEKKPRAAEDRTESKPLYDPIDNCPSSCPLKEGIGGCPHGGDQTRCDYNRGDS